MGRGRRGGRLGRALRLLDVRDLLHPVAISSVHPVRIPLPIPATHRQAVRRIASMRL